MKLSLLLICTAPSKWWCALSFSTPPTNLPILAVSSSSSVHHIFCDGAATKLFSSANNEPSGAASSGEGLRSLLPTPKKRTLQLDKLGRRIHDLTDDGTTQYSKRSDGNVAIAADSVPMQSDHDITAQLSEVGETEASESPSLSKILTSNLNENDEEDTEIVVTIAPSSSAPPSLKSSKELAAIASSADFSKKISKSADLKALLPTQKMRFMKLDNFGRRVQRMEDDGTVNMKKEPTPKNQSEEEVATTPSQQKQDQNQMPVRSYRGTRDGFSSDINAAAEAAASPPPAAKEAEAPIKMSQSLSDILGTKEDRPSLYDAMLVGEGDSGVNLKELLPTQKTRFMDVDKFGRRVQQMEDDGTVNMKKEPSVATASSGISSAEKANESNNESAAVLDLGNNVKSGTANYGSLKKLLSESNKGNNVKSGAANYGSLKKLLSESDKESAAALDLGNNVESGAANYGQLKNLLTTKRATWTKLDFKGGSVVDERRIKKEIVQDPVPTTDSAAAGGSLKELLPKRATWTKLDFKGGSVEDTRRTKNRSTSSSSSSGSFNEGQYSNLKTLLPQRTITWKQKRVLRSGSAAPVSNTGAHGLREERQQAMKNEVIASAATDASSEDNDIEEEIKPYSNLKDLLPVRKFRLRENK